MNKIKLDMVITDLDGTLFKPDQSISNRDYRTLELLGKHNICRVVATGRLLYSARKVIPEIFPIDYLIFSTGAGIMNWQTKERLYARNLHPDEVSYISHVLIDQQVDFMILNPIPDTHYFTYYKTEKQNPDFMKRYEIYKPYAQSFSTTDITSQHACQFLAIVPEGIEAYENMKNSLTDFKVIRTTSPIDGKTMWVEIFPNNVSKGNAAEWLCNKVNCNPAAVLGIGNDYNDVDLLNYTGYSYVMANAPDDLKKQYKVTETNINSGFSKAVMEHWDSI